MEKTLWENRNFLVLICAQTISNIGDWLHIMALFGLVAFKWNASPFAVTGVLLCMTIPVILFGSLSGMVADRFNRKALMIITDIARAALVLGIAFSTTLWQVYLFLFLFSVCSSLFSPAKSGVLREIVKVEQLQPAIAYSEMINHAAKIIGPALSGAFIVAVGIQWAFYIDAISFIISAVILLLLNYHAISKNNNDQNQKQKTHFFTYMVEGLQMMRESAVLITGLIIICAVIFAIQIADSQIMILLRGIEGMSIDLVGYSMAASGAGMLVSSAILSKKSLGQSFITLMISPFVLGVMLILAIVSVHFPLTILNILYPVAFFIVGFSFSMAMIPFNVMAQKKTPETHTGRVFGTINSMTTLAVLIGLLIGGSLSQWFGVEVPFIASGILLICISFGAGVIVKSGRKNVSEEGVNETL